MRAAAILDIPFLTLDLEKEYKEGVVDHMTREYRAGRTPNPDVMCNKEIKFGHFLKFALQNGADFVATGHYTQNKNGKLLEGTDKNKDQSYFLWTLTPEQLQHILFPIGHLQKAEVRKLAQKFKLPQATKKDSQGLCFLGQIDMKEFLKEFVGAEKGDVLNARGEKIGEHEGALLYTIGERHGFSVENKSTDNEPMYVTTKDIKNNTITVGNKHLERSSDRAAEEVKLIDTNWTSREEPHLSQTYSCRIRYRGEKIPCQIRKNKAVLSEPRIDISAGQSLVLYDNEICLGGGIIGA